MRRVPILVAILTLASATDALAQPADVYVSPDGNDAWSGRVAEANAGGTDGPLATPIAASGAVRAIREREPHRATPVVVQFRGGTYFLADTWSLNADDAGRDVSPTIYAAFPGETPVLSGGRRMDNWAVGADGRWHTNVPQHKDAPWRFAQLFADGQRRFRPRLPEDGYHHIAARVPPRPATNPADRRDGDDGFRFPAGSVDPGWKNLGDVEIVTFHPWFTSMLRIDSIDRKQNVVRFTGATRTSMDWGQLKPQMRFLIDNVAEALKKPGQWYFDSPTRQLTYIPMPGEDPKKTVVIAPRLEQLLTIGTPRQRGVPPSPAVQHVHFRGLTFAHTNWVVPPEGFSAPQAAQPVPAAVSASNARDIVFDGCTFAQLGGYGVELGAECKDGRIERCRFLDLGCGGIKIGVTGAIDEARAPELLCERHVVRDNLIAHGGRLHPAAVGIWIGQAAHCTVEHNDIHDFYYTGISVGWTWGYGPSNAHHNSISYNRIHTLGQGVLSDMGGIYTLGRSEGTVLRGNVMHDIERYNYGGWGIYYDEGTTGIVARDNLVYSTHDGGFHQHYGSENFVVNNIFGPSREVQFGPSRADSPAQPGVVRPGLVFTFERNIVHTWGDPSVIRPNWLQGVSSKNLDRYACNRNVYWNGSKPVQFAGLSFEQWREKGYDKDGLVADPMLKDVAGRDYTVNPDSPALKLGFEPFDPNRAGRTVKEPADLDPVRWPRAFPKPDRSPQTLRDDFESTPVGAVVDHAHTSEENDVATIRVTDAIARNGRRSLKFTDAPGQRHGFNPHLFWQPQGYTSGTAVARFSLRREADVPFFHEWRTAGHPYRTGPSIAIAPSGALRFKGDAEPRLTVPPDKWMDVHITCPLGAAAGSYNVTIRIEGEEPCTFRGVGCESGFDRLDWFGFTASGDKSGNAYVDDLELRLQP